MLYDEIARRLLIHIYYPISAAAEIAESGNVLRISLFDTDFCALPELFAPDAKEVWLFTQHPDGCMELYESDRLHVRRFMEQCCGRRFRVFVTNEDFICREYALFPPEEM